MLAIIGELAGIAEALVAGLERQAAVVERVARQARQRIAGVVPDGSERVVSLHDPDARPIRKGRLGVPVEFGYKAQVLDNSDGIVLNYQVVLGNPADAPMLVPAIGRIKELFGEVPRSVTADRGYGEAKVDASLQALGVGFVAIPRRGRPGPPVATSSRAGVSARSSNGGQARRAYLGPEAPLRLGPHPDGRRGRCPHLVRLGPVRPQCHQGHRLGPATGPTPQRPTDRLTTLARGLTWLLAPRAPKRPREWTKRGRRGTGDAGCPGATGDPCHP